MTRKIGLLLLLLLIVVLPSRGMILHAGLVLFAVSVLVARHWRNPGSMLVLGLGTIIAAGILTFLPSLRPMPAANLPGLFTGIIGMMVISLICCGFFIRGMQRRQLQKTTTTSS